MKIFWSWQSDIPGKVSRHFVRDALETAIGELRATDSSVEDSDRPEDLHLDHDRKGVTGSPDLFSTIVEKIRNSTVFVADVTPVATTPEGKKVMNPNVALELGTAIEALGSEGVLLILNTAYGDRDSLPFDLRHKAGPIMYSLSADSKKGDIEREKRQLVGTLKEAIELYIINSEKSISAASAATPFDPGADWKDQTSFGKEDRIEVVSSGVLGGQPKTILTTAGGRLFLRVYPMTVIQERSVGEIEALVSGRWSVTPFHYLHGMGLWARS
jgi:hypothetical protein